MKRILKARVLEKAIINIKASREKDGDEILPIEEFSTILEEDNFHEKVTLTVKRVDSERIKVYGFIESSGQDILINIIRVEEW